MNDTYNYIFCRLKARPTRLSLGITSFYGYKLIKKLSKLKNEHYLGDTDPKLGLPASIRGDEATMDNAGSLLFIK